MRNFVDRFFAKVARPDGDGCWEWVGARNRHGYGLFSVDGRSRLAHRVSYELAHGPIALDAKVLHSCDRPHCVNPSHLWLGTQADNVRDMTQKGRQCNGAAKSAVCRRVAPRGEQHWASSVSAQDVAAIRKAVASGDSRRALGRKFGIHESTVRAIERGRSWREASL